MRVVSDGERVWAHGSEPPELPRDHAKSDDGCEYVAHGESRPHAIKREFSGKDQQERD